MQELRQRLADELKSVESSQIDEIIKMVQKHRDWGIHVCGECGILTSCNIDQCSSCGDKFCFECSKQHKRSTCCKTFMCDRCMKSSECPFKKCEKCGDFTCHKHSEELYPKRTKDCLHHDVSHQGWPKKCEECGVCKWCWDHFD